MQEHDAANEVEPEKHGQAEGHVDGHPLGSDDAAVVGQLRRPQEVVLAGYWVHGADDELEADLAHALPRHGDPPIVRAIVDQE